MSDDATQTTDASMRPPQIAGENARVGSREMVQRTLEASMRPPQIAGENQVLDHAIREQLTLQ